MALVHYGFVLKNLDLNYEDAAIYLQEGIDSNEEDTQDGRFYFALGESLQRMGKNEEAMEVIIGFLLSLKLRINLYFDCRFIAKEQN